MIECVETIGVFLYFILNKKFAISPYSSADICLSLKNYPKTLHFGEFPRNIDDISKHAYFRSFSFSISNTSSTSTQLQSARKSTIWGCDIGQMNNR